MKILAIRGKNLASLSSEFAIDFQAEPLASAGLFAITGPTGAGKSTLLDALCLALYEKTPRLARANARSENVPDVGEHAVGTGDPRNLLRRGASEGWAEVDFVGSDGVAYRSRWSVRRARNKAAGRLQQTEFAFSRLADGQALGDHRKTETLRLIEERIGLNFEQFTRAVLLAQNDFATFLKAGDDDRAELLQTLTGTETFTRLSTQAYDRMKAEKEALERLQQQLQAGAPWTPEERSAAEAQLALEGVALQSLAQRKAGLERDLLWHERAAQLQRQAEEAARLLTEAEAAQAAALPRRERLALLDRVQPARLLLAEAGRTEQAVRDEEASTQGHQQGLAQSQVEAAARQQALPARQQALEQAEQARTQAQPGLDQATTLDDRIAQAGPRLEAARAAGQEAQGQLEQADAALDAARTRQAQCQAALEQTGQWLASHEPQRVLAEQWPRWQALLEQAGARREQQQQLQATTKEQQARQQELTVQLQAALADAQACASRRDQARQALDALNQASATLDPQQLAAERALLEARRESLQEAGNLWARLAELGTRRNQLEAQQQDQSARLRQHASALEQAQAALPRLEGELASAEQALQAARLAASAGAETLRASLSQGQPCPVCGSAEHPYAQHAPGTDAVLQSLEEHRQARRASLDAALREQAAADAGQSVAQAALQGLAQELDQVGQAKDQAQSTWAALPLHAELATVPDAGRSDWINRQQATARASLNRIAEQEAHQRQLLQQRRAAEQVLAQAQGGLEAAQERRAPLERDSTSLEQALESARQQAEQAALELKAVLGELDPALVDAEWRERWQADPLAFAAQAAEAALQWTTRQQQAQQLQTELQLIDGELRAAVQAQQQAEVQQGAAQATLQQIEMEIAGHRTERAALFAGQPVAQVRAGLDAAVDAARQALEQLNLTIQRDREQVSRLQEALAQGQRRLEQQRTAARLAHAQLQDWIAAFDAGNEAGNAAGVSAEALTLERLRELLASDGAAVAREREALDALLHAGQKAQAVLADRRQSLQEHETGRGDIAPAEELQ
ncbi:MAG: hypothetical protein RJA36_576, partial [Pseudomonadota bacterium]